MKDGPLLTAILSGLLVAAPVLAIGPQAEGASGEAQGDTLDSITAIIEIPAGGDVKYERDGDGRIFVDRFLSAPVVYPANYGSIDGTLAGDGDPLDILVYSRSPIISGARIEVRPIGILRMVDAGEDDQKIIAVPVSGVDSSYDGIKSISDLPAGTGARLAAFFRMYKQDTDGNSPVMLSGYGDINEAKAVLRAAFARTKAR